MIGGDIRQRPGFRIVVLLLLALFAVSALLCAMRCGSRELSYARIIETLWNADGGTDFLILYYIRLPRVVLGAMVGASLALSGAILQGVMRNPLASPGIIGVSSGGGLAGILMMLAFPQFSFLLVPAAFVGALTTAFLVYLLAWKQGASPVRLILAGVAVAAMLGAFSSAVLLFHAEKAGGILDFSIGSLATGSWPKIRQVQYYLLAGFVAAPVLSDRLNILALGDEIAAGLGLKVEWTRFCLIAVAALLAAAAVSVAGLLGFVGLIAPHIMRLIIGSDHRFLIPAAALFGKELEKHQFSTPSLPIYSNATGAVYGSDMKATLSKQIDSPVRWEMIVRAMMESGIGTFIEIGPGSTLTGLIRKIDSSVRTFNAADRNGIEAIREGL